MSEEVEGEWGVVEFTRKLDLDSVRFTTPDGFKFELYQKSELIQLLMALSLEEGELQFSSSRFKIGPHGTLLLLDTDVWDNVGFRFGRVVCGKRELAAVVGKYLLGKQR